MRRGDEEGMWRVKTGQAECRVGCDSAASRPGAGGVGAPSNRDAWSRRSQCGAREGTEENESKGLKTYLRKKEGFPGGAVVENLPANAGDTGSSPGLGRSHMPRSD